MSSSPYARERATPRPRSRPQVPLTRLLPEAVGATADVTVSGITVDSRLVQPGDLYVALPGSHQHGAAYVDEVVRSGAVAVVTDPAGRAMITDPRVPVIVVEDPRSRVAALAVGVYDSPATRTTMFGLTGTNGKTTTSFLLEAACRSAGQRTGIIGTIGFSLDGEPLPGVRTTVTTPEATELQALIAAMVEDNADAVVMEVSSHALALGRADGIVFDVAGFTNFGSDHLDFHGDLESYFEAKALLFTAQHARRAVINLDDPRGRTLADRARLDGLPVINVSLDRTDADYAAGPIQAGAGGGSRTVARTPTGPREIGVAMPGDYNVRNGLTALAMAEAVGLDGALAAAGIATAHVPGRMQPVPLGPGAPSVVVDFAHTPQAVTAVLTALAGRRRIAVLGSGGDRDPGKRGPMGAAATTAEVVVVTDDNPRSEDPAAIRAAVLAGAREAAHAGIQVIDGGDRRSAIRLSLELTGPDDVVAILGKGHERGQEIAGAVHPFDDVAVVAQEWSALQTHGGLR